MHSHTYVHPYTCTYNSILVKHQIKIKSFFYNKTHHLKY